MPYQILSFNPVESTAVSTSSVKSQIKLEAAWGRIMYTWTPLLVNWSAILAVQFGHMIGTSISLRGFGSDMSRLKQHVARIMRLFVLLR